MNEHDVVSIPCPRLKYIFVLVTAFDLQIYASSSLELEFIASTARVERVVKLPPILSRQLVSE